MSVFAHIRVLIIRNKYREMVFGVRKWVQDFLGADQREEVKAAEAQRKRFLTTKIFISILLIV